MEEQHKPHVDLDAIKEEYDFFSLLEKIHFEDEMKEDIRRKKGFIVQSSGTIKKKLKDDDGIFSSKFGQTLQDINPFADKYKCGCGEMMGRVNLNIMCKACKTKVKFVDDDFGYFGWIVFETDFFAIHPNLFKAIEYLIGAKRLDNIIKPISDKNQDGHIRTDLEKPKDEPFLGIGMFEFKERFNEIMDYYVKKYPKKLDVYEMVMADRHKVFTKAVPVFTSLLRPYFEEGEYLRYHKTNEMYSLMTSLANKMNSKSLASFCRDKPRMQLPYDFQMQYIALYNEIVETLSGKKGRVKGLFGGRCNFTARNVIIPDPTLKTDEVRMSYFSLVELLQQSIINILCKTHNMSNTEAYNLWYKSSINVDRKVWNIIESIINNSANGRGIPILINRNPTISYGGILQVYIVSITDGYTLSVPLNIIKIMAADFDGDVLNSRLIINDDFLRYANRVFNPRKAMFVSRNDGLFNNDMNHSRDTIININTLLRKFRTKYTKSNIDKIRAFQNM